MRTALTLHAAPAAGFDEPFAMLQGCHERVERTLRLLERLRSHLVVHGADAQAREAAADVLRYFDKAGPAHHEDEERHLFPTLRASADPAVRRTVQQLGDEHRTMSVQWAGIRNDLQAVVQGRLQAGSDEQRAQRWGAFAALYRQHMAIEEAQAIPAAQARLSPAEVAAAGREMAARRGVSMPQPAGEDAVR
jgi:hemerythrin-like domain-containing protein